MPLNRSEHKTQSLAEFCPRGFARQNRYKLYSLPRQHELARILLLAMIGVKVAVFTLRNDPAVDVTQHFRVQSIGSRVGVEIDVQPGAVEQLPILLGQRVRDQ